MLRRRLRGVLVARQYVMMDYDISEDLLEAATKITPGMQSPTISPLDRDGSVAVRAMVRKRDTNKIMDSSTRPGPARSSSRPFRQPGFDARTLPVSASS